MNPRFSVIIPTYNQAQFLQKAIQSVIDQTYKDWEMIIVDNYSTDNTDEILKPYVEKGLIRYIKHDKNYERAKSRNTGMQNAKGDFLTLLDSDDYWAREKLQLQINKMHSAASDIVYCQGVEVDIYGAKIREHRSNFLGECYEFFILNPTISIFPLPCSSIVFRKSLIIRSGLFDTKFLSFAEDWDFFRRLSEYATVGQVDEYLVFYVRHNANSTNAKLINHFKGNKRALKKVILDLKDFSSLLKFKIWFKFYGNP